MRALSAPALGDRVQVPVFAVRIYVTVTQIRPTAMGNRVRRKFIVPPVRRDSAGNGRKRGSVIASPEWGRQKESLNQRQNIMRWWMAPIPTAGGETIGQTNSTCSSTLSAS